MQCFKKGTLGYGKASIIEFITPYGLLNFAPKIPICGDNMIFNEYFLFLFVTSWDTNLIRFFARFSYQIPALVSSVIGK